MLQPPLESALTVDARGGIPSTTSAISYAPHTRKLTPANKNDSVRPSRQMRRISQCRSRLPLHPARARRLPPSHTHPRLTPGHTPHKAPTNVSHPRNRPTRPDPTQIERRPLGLLQHSRSQQHTPPKPPTDTIERGRHTTRGYPNPTNYQPRTLLTAESLDASTHTQL